MFNRNLTRYPGDIEEEYSLDAVKEAFKALYEIEGYRTELNEMWEAFVTFGSVILANRLFVPPTWLIIVGASSTMKTSILAPYLSLERDKYVYHISAVTKNAFSSGERGAEDILSDIPNKSCLYIPEMASFLGNSDDIVRKVIGEMTAAYDRKFVKKSGTSGGEKRISKSIGLIAALTIEMKNKYDRKLSEAGGRFMIYKMPRLSDDYVDLLSRKNESDLNEKENILRKKIGIYMRDKIKKMDALKKTAFNKTPDNVHNYLRDASKILKVEREDGTILRIKQVLLNLAKGMMFFLTERTILTLDIAEKATMNLIKQGLSDEKSFILSKIALGCEDYEEILNEFSALYTPYRKLKAMSIIRNLIEIGILKSSSVTFNNSTRRYVSLSEEYEGIIRKMFNVQKRNGI